VHPGVDGFVRLAPGQLFMVDEFTVPRYRRRGITRQMAYAMNPWVLGAGFHDVLGVHRTDNYDNYDTIAATRAKGVTRLGTITKWRLLARTIFRFEPERRLGVDRIHERLAHDAAVVLESAEVNQSGG
jgi:hypothetical protein